MADEEEIILADLDDDEFGPQIPISFMTVCKTGNCPRGRNSACPRMDTL